MAGPVGEYSGSYPFLNRFSTGTLRRLLREDLASKESSTPECDTFITCVAEVVARREAADPALPQFDVEAGWQDLLKHPEATGTGAFAADPARMAAQWTQFQSGDEPEASPET